MLRYVMRMPPLSSLTVDEVVALIAPSVQRYLTADAAELGLESLSLQRVDPLVEHQ